MGFINRAILYITRKRGRSALLLIILLVMATFVLTGLSIVKAVRAAQSGLRQTLGGEFRIMPDYSEHNPYFKTKRDSEGNVMLSTERPVTEDVVNAILNINGIKSYDASSQYLVFVDLDIYPGTVPVKAEYKDMAYAQITANSENSRFFRTGTVRLAEGRHLTESESHSAIISQDLADKNNLGIGDSLTLNNNTSVKVEIIGLYEILKPDPPYQSITSYDKLENQIFCDLDTLKDLNSEKPVGFETAAFQVTDPAQLEDIISQVKQIPSIDWSAYIVETNHEIYLNAAAPLSRLQTLVSSFLLAIILVSAAILSLILTMWGKNRIHETGVFLAIGIRKREIIGQYLTEVLVIAVFAFGLSYFTGNAAADRLAGKFLQQNIMTDTELQNMAAGREPDGSTGYDTKRKDDTLNVTVTSKQTSMAEDSLTQAGGLNEAPCTNMPSSDKDTLSISPGLDNMVQLYLIGFAIITLSVCISSSYILRLKPKEILSRMS